MCNDSSKFIFFIYWFFLFYLNDKYQVFKAFVNQVFTNSNSTFAPEEHKAIKAQLGEYRKLTFSVNTEEKKESKSCSQHKVICASSNPDIWTAGHWNPSVCTVQQSQKSPPWCGIAGWFSSLPCKESSLLHLKEMFSCFNKNKNRILRTQKALG